MSSVNRSNTASTEPTPVDHLGHLHQLGRYVDRYLADGMVYRGHPLIKSSHLLLLRKVHDGITSTELVRQLGITKQGVSHLVQQLLANDYLESKPALNDCRAIQLFLSEKGKAVLAIANELLDQMKQRFDDLAGPSASENFVLYLSHLAVYTSKG